MRNYKAKNRHVLFLRTGLPITNRLTYDGVYSYGREHGWQIQSVRVPSIMDRDLTISQSSETRRLKNLLAFWKPDGCVAMGDVCRPYRNLVNFGGLPLVYCDAIPETLQPGANVVRIDGNVTADSAARELLNLGLDHFAYVAYPRRLPWCDERGRCFGKIIEMNGKTIISARLPELNASVSAKQSFVRWLVNLPKPVGIFAANDQVAEEVVGICIQAGMSIPCDVAVVGVDNDEMLCENAAVSVTSIVPDFIGAGRIAAELLDELIAVPAISQVRCFGVSGVVRRESTRRLANTFDARVMRSLEFIRLHACCGISVPDVVKMMGCSRRYADLRFAQVVGWSILQEIRRVKVEKVKELLRETGRPLGVIADMCGFKSCDDMRRTFRQFEGDSLSSWRRMAAGVCKA